MFNLQYGVTGFYNSKESPPPVVDIEYFNNKCFTAARELRGKIVEPNKSSPIKNFTFKTLSIFEDQISVLLNNHYPIIAFAKPPVEYGNIDFFEIEKVVDWFENNSKFIYPGLALLFNPVNDFLDNLNPAEVSEINGHKPEALGELIFNFWD